MRILLANFIDEMGRWRRLHVVISTMTFGLLVFVLSWSFFVRVRVNEDYQQRVKEFENLKREVQELREVLKLETKGE